MAFTETDLERASLLPIGRGLFILRYSKGRVGDPQVASVRPAPGSELSIAIISPPGAALGQLSAPGACLVVRAEQAGNLQIVVRRRLRSDAYDASFYLEPIAARENHEEIQIQPAIQVPERSVVAAEGPDAIGAAIAAPPSFSILGHLSRRGDVEVAAGEWLGGPQLPRAIEGLEIRAPQGSNTRIEMQVLVGTDPPRWLDWVAHGVFVGTRQRALPLSGIRLRLVGSDADRFELVAEALFLGSAISSGRGQQVEFVGAGGVDPLVGFRLAISQGNRQHSPVRAAAPGVEKWEQPVPTRVEAKPVVRVFRTAAGV